MNQFKKNKSLSDKFDAHESPMDLEQFWDNLEPKLPNKKKDRKYFFFWIALGMIGLASLAIISQNNKQEDKIKSEIATNTSSNAAIPTSSNHELSIENKIEPAKDQNINSENETNTALNLDIQQTITTKQTSSPSTKISIKNPKNANAIAIITNNIAEKREEQISSTLNDSKKETSSDQANYQAINAQDIVMNQASLIQATDKPISEHPSENNDNKIKLEANFNNIKEANNIVKTKIIENNDSILSNKITESNIHNSNSEINTENTVQITATNETESKKDRIKMDFNYFIEPVIGIGFYHRELKSKDAFDLSYINNRNLHETALEEILCGMLIGLQHKKISLVTGIQYTRKNEKFQYDVYYNQGNYQKTLVLQKYTNDTTRYQYLDAWQDSNYLRHVVHYNQINQWSIPLTMRYTWSHKRISLSPELGLNWIISTKIKGKTLDRQSFINEWGTSFDLQYYNKMEIGFTAGLQCAYQMNRNWSIITGIKYQRISSKQWIKPIDLSFNSYYYHTGIKYSF